MAVVYAVVEKQKSTKASDEFQRYKSDDLSKNTSNP